MIKDSFDVDIAILGSGAASLFAAQELLNRGISNFIIIEKARRLNDARNVGLAWLGGAARSAAKVSFQAGFGGEIEDQEILDYTKSMFEAAYPGQMKLLNSKPPKSLSKRLDPLGITVQNPEVYGVTEDKFIKMGMDLYTKMRENATIIHKIDVKNITKDKGRFFIETNDRPITANKLIVGVGRSGHLWFDDLNKNFDLEHECGSFDLGYRLEVPLSILGKLIGKSKTTRFRFGDFKTSVPVFDGDIEAEEVGHVKISNGRSTKQGKKNMVNFSFLKKFNVPKSHKEAYRLTEIANILSDGQLLREPLSKILDGDSALEPVPEYATINEGLRVLADAIPEIKRKCYVYAPDSRLNAVRYKLSEGMESNVEGVYVIGDMTGLTKSFGQAAATGVLAARDLSKEKK